MNSIKNIVIVAGGKNSRFKEMSIFPKLLLPINSNDSILTHDVKMFGKYNVFVVINALYYDMVCDYVNALSLNVKVIKSENTNGSANTLRAVKDELPKEDVMFLWSDLILDRDSVENLIERANSSIYNFVFGTYELDYRLGVNENGVITEGEHNLPGIYFAFDTKELFDFKEDGELDLAERINQMKYKGVEEYTGNLLEFRDKSTFLKYYRSMIPSSSGMQPRFFNQISINGDKLIKKCINHCYDALIEREASWYKLLQVNNLEDIGPKFYSFNDKTKLMEIEFIDGDNVYKALNSETMEPIMKGIKENLDKLHSIKVPASPTSIISDAKKEYFDKPLQRCQKIKHMLVNYDEVKLISLLTKAFDEIMEGIESKDSYYLTHGDLNMSNMIYSKDGKVKFIDPRGYFGGSVNYGPKEYDYAKVLYALTGFDTFNSQNYVYYSDGVYDKPEDRTWAAPEWLNTRTYRLIVATIWISLSSYIAQDIYKANIAYEYGMEMLEKELNNK